MCTRKMEIIKANVINELELLTTIERFVAF